MSISYTNIISCIFVYLFDCMPTRKCGGRRIAVHNVLLRRKSRGGLTYKLH